MRLLRLCPFSSLLSLLTLLTVAGCQPDKPARTEQRAPALADSLALDTLAEPLGTLDTTPVRRDWHRLERPTPAKAPIIVYRSTRRAPAGLSSGPPPGEPTLFDIAQRASEYFQINPAQAAEVRGRAGTIVRIPAGSLVDGRQQAARGPVWVELKECYTPADMLLTNLSSLTPDGQLLQTAGMVLVRATAAGRPLQLAAGRTFYLEMPAHGKPRPGIRLYYGQEGSGPAPVRWVAAPEAAGAPEETVYDDAHPMPAYGRGPADINKLIRYPREAMASRTEGLVFASFVVDERGRVLRPRILRGLGHGCDEEVLRVLRQTSGHWTPGQRDGEFVKVKMMLPIRFSFHEGLLSTPPDTSTAPAVASTAAPSPEEADALADVPPATAYGFRCAQLGWLNADQPLSVGAARLAVGHAAPDGAVRLVLRGAAPTILDGQPTDEGYQFERLPAGRRAVVLGLRYEGGLPYVAWQELVTGQALPAPLEYRETTLAELERRLARL